jgi:hypothetical protein
MLHGMDQVLSDNPAFTRSILGTADPEEIAARLDGFCKEHLGSRLKECFFCELSVGAAFGLLLHDGRRVFLKAHKLGWSAEFLEAVRRVQGYLFKRGFPCPRPLAGPASFGPGLATAEEFVDVGEHVDAHEPVIRCRMAQALARAIELAGEVQDVEALSSGWAWPKDDLWPVPHNALFDFEATAAGAGWIDRIAAEVKRVMDRFHGRVVVGHADWSVKHFRFAGGKVRVVYDWDSLRLDKEVIIVGTAAATFPATWYLEVASRAPSPNELWSFLEEYGAARGYPLSSEERHATAAVALYVMAYVARCEHAIDPEGEDLSGGFREVLTLHSEAYFRSGSSGRSRGRS